MKTLRFTFALCIAIILAVAARPALGQVSLAPTFVYVDSPERFGSVVITNNSLHVQEVIIDYAFGYPSADSAGRRFIQYEDVSAARRYDLSGWIRSFPQRFRVEPGRRQVVRMIVQPPHGLEDGVYWTRMTITSTESTSSSGSGSRGTTAEIDFEVKQVIPIVYRKGTPSTSAYVSDLFTETDARGTEFRAVIERDGDAPFLGTAVLTLKDASGVQVGEIATTSEVYFRSSTHFHFDASVLTPGSYTADVSLLPRRSDVPSRHLPSMTPAQRRFDVDIPEPARAVADAE